MAKFFDPIFYHHYCHRIFFWLFILCFIAQIFFWKKTESIHSPIEIVPQAPSQAIIQILSFGDNQFLFRILGVRLQNMGDVFAGFVSLKNYDYHRLYQWMTKLDTIDNNSRLIPSLASYYYSNTSKESDLRLLVKYLQEHSVNNVDKHWWWLFQATQIARNDIKDLDLAMSLAQQLASNQAKDAPLWTKQMPAFIAKVKGDNCLAFQVISKILTESENGIHKITAEEMNFMRYFIKKNLANFKQKKFDPRKCLNKI